MNIPIQSIMKYIMSVYNPDDIYIDKKETSQLKLIIYFEHIDDKYITNPDSINLFRNKEVNLENKIRYDIETFFTVRTSGLRLIPHNSGILTTAPYTHSYLSIVVTSNRSKE